MSTVTNNPTSRSDTSQALRVGDLLLEKGLITDAQVEQAVAYQRQKGHRKLLGEVLVELQFVTAEQVLAVLAEAYGVPFARITPKVADPRVIEVLPREFLQKNNVLPLFLVNGKLTLAVHEPANVFIVEEVERLTGHSVQIVAATARDIEATLRAHLPSANVFVIDELVDEMADDDLSVVEHGVADLSDADALASESPIIKLVNHLVFAAVTEGASDIHIEPGDQSLRVRFRIDGQLFQKMRPPHAMLPAIVSRIKIMAGLDISERRVPQDGGITVMVEKRQIDLRVSTMPGKHGEKVVIRIIDARNALVALDKLGFSATMLERFRGAVTHSNGIVLVTGPTGSGKSTTLYSVLNEVNNDAVNISTVEDPVEYSVPGINQFQVNEKAGFSFAGALRALLRQDPDIVMVGEIRDQETARIATQAAMTGHLVLSTLHTNDAPSAITRLFNIGVEPYLVAASIRGVLAQRLVRKICTHCREEVESDAASERLIKQLGAPADTRLFRGKGCQRCRDTGYAGRLGIYELYVPDDESLDAISRGAGLQELRRIARSSGRYTTLRADGLEKASAGLTTLEEVIGASEA